jgi:leukotriene-A4 hydrolase
MRALMSALSLESQNDKNTFYFNQPTKIPSYLIALGDKSFLIKAVGDIVGIKVGPRTTVWSEPGFVEKAAYEFEMTETFIQLGETLLDSKYEWGVYDLLVLPASFPYGGMENPCLTFGLYYSKFI